MGKLTDKQCKTLGKGMHADGSGLYLHVTDTGTRRFLMRWTAKDGRRAKKSVGIYPEITLADARERALDMRRDIRQGIDPRRKPDVRSIPTFGEAAATYIAAKESEFSNPKHIAQWRMRRRRLNWLVGIWA